MTLSNGFKYLPPDNGIISGGAEASTFVNSLMTDGFLLNWKKKLTKNISFYNFYPMYRLSDNFEKNEA